MATVTITRRSRNIGFGWTNQPVRQFNERGDGGSYLVIGRVAAPDFVGTPRQVLTELARAQRVNSGNDWRCALFVGGRRVLRDEMGDSPFEQLEWLCDRSDPETAVSELTFEVEE